MDATKTGPWLSQRSLKTVMSWIEVCFSGPVLYNLQKSLSLIKDMRLTDMRMSTMGQESQGLTGRTVYFDYLRVIASLAVMVLHVSSQYWSSIDVNRFAWQVFNCYDGIVRWGVPIFVMISGALFLSREIPIKRIYSKYVLRMASSFFVWSTIYALVVGGSPTEILAAIVSGHYHMWFILMIIGLYVTIPVVKPMVENDERCRYFLLLSLVFAFVLPWSMTLMDDLGSPLVVALSRAMRSGFNDMNVRVFTGFVGFFVLGYYLNRVELDKRQRAAIYVLGLIGFVFTVVMTSVVSLRAQKCDGYYYGNFTVNVLCEVLAVFTWFKYRSYNNDRANRFVLKLSRYCFGAYLVHPLIIRQLRMNLGIHALMFNPIASVPCISLLVFVISFGIAALLNRVPVVRDYMV